MDIPQTNPIRIRLIAGIFIALAIFSFLLLLDLQNRGLAWQFFWSQTGEEQPFAQIRGMMELGGNLIRSPLNTAADVPINHKTDIPYGINTFLHEEVEIPKIEEQLRMIKEAGFVWLRQEFPWEDIEVDGRGQFTDTRWDYDGDGEKDTIDAWEKYDRIVDLVESYGLKLMVRLSNPPNWSRANPDAGDFAPPDDFQDYANFAAVVAERYKGRITHYQVWNEPNIFPEWGNTFIDPAGYTDLLCTAYEAIKAVDPEIVVISGALAQTISLDGYGGYTDVIFLQNMYDHGAADCFDVLSVQAYGLFSGPTDRRMRPTTITFARHLYIRDIMVAYGDAHKPIWISEAAWNAVPSEDVKPDVADRYRFGQVTEEQAGRYMPIAYQRAQDEWPWVGTVFYWFFTRRTIEESNQSFYYFRMAEADYGPDHPTFTPLPVYHTMQDYIQTQTPILYPGVHQAETWQVTAQDAVLFVDEAAQFGEALEAQVVEFNAYGTDIELRLRMAEQNVEIVIDGQLINPRLTDEDGWESAPIFTSMIAGEHTVQISAIGAQNVVIDSINVADNTGRNILLPIGIGVVALLIGNIVVLRRRRG